MADLVQTARSLVTALESMERSREAAEWRSKFESCQWKIDVQDLAALLAALQGGLGAQEAMDPPPTQASSPDAPALPVGLPIARADADVSFRQACVTVGGAPG